MKRTDNFENGFALMAVLVAAVILAIAGVAFSNMARSSFRSVKHAAIAEDILAVQKIVRDALADPAQCFAIYRNHGVNGNACANGAAVFISNENVAVTKHVPGSNDVYTDPYAFAYRTELPDASNYFDIEAPTIAVLSPVAAGPGASTTVPHAHLGEWWLRARCASDGLIIEKARGADPYATPAVLATDPLTKRVEGWDNLFEPGTRICPVDVKIWANGVPGTTSAMGITNAISDGVNPVAVLAWSAPESAWGCNVGSTVGPVFPPAPAFSTSTLTEPGVVVRNPAGIFSFQCFTPMSPTAPVTAQIKVN